MTSDDPERSSRDPNTLRVQYRENNWRYYLVTIANYQIVCCEACSAVGCPSVSLVFRLTNLPHLLHHFIHKIIRVLRVTLQGPTIQLDSAII